MIGAVLAGKLLADLRPLLGSNIFPKRLDEGAELPAVTYDVSPKSSLQSLSGSLGAEQVRVRFTVWAESYQQCEELRAAIRDSLDGFHGTLAGTRIGHVLMQQSGPEEFEPDEGTSSGVFHDTIEFDVFYYL